MIEIIIGAIIGLIWGCGLACHSNDVSRIAKNTTKIANAITVEKELTGDEKEDFAIKLRKTLDE